MDSGLIRQLNTSTRARSTGPDTPLRDPMEDADSSSTRKRPRLDSGDRAYRSMSADPTRPPSSNMDLSRVQGALADEQSPSQPAEESNRLPSNGLTPSKVTINVREPVGKTSPTRQYADLNGTTPTRGGRENGGASFPHMETPALESSSSPRVISVTSSPSHSPEIEVAEVEDINDDSGETRWRPLESAIASTSIQEAKDTQAVILDQFPHLSGQNLKKTLNLIATAFAKSKQQWAQSHTVSH